jgi:hypothetical protein
VKRFIVALLFAALAFAGAQASARASTILDLGDVTNSTLDQNTGPGAGPVDLNIKFSLTQASAVSLSLSNLIVPGGFFDIANFSATSADLTLTGVLGGPFSFAGLLVAGDYLIHVTGQAVGTLGGLVNVALTAATPIPGALLLFVSAIGGMAGFAGLRRRGSAAA